MSKSLMLLSATSFAIIGSGCASRPLYYEQDHFRMLLLQLYDDQVMDNLVRVRNNRPIIQLDYGKITGTVSVDTNGGIGGEHLNASSSLTDKFTYALGGSVKNQITVTAEPVLNDHSLYGRYLAYLKKNGGKGLRVNNLPRCEGEVHRTLAYKGDVYWIPTEYASDYFELALGTTVLRNEPLKAPTTFDVQLTSVGSSQTCLEDKPLPECTEWMFRVNLDKPIPNDSGWAEGITIKGSTYSLRVRSNPDVAPGTQTQVIYLVYATSEVNHPVVDVMAGVSETKQIRIKLEHYSPPVSKLEKSLDDLFHESQLFRLEAAGD